MKANNIDDLYFVLNLIINGIPSIHNLNRVQVNKVCEF